MADKDESERETLQLFDLMFKYILKEASSGAIVHFINGLFDKDYPIDSSVTFAATESVVIQQSQKQKMGKIQSDIILILNDDPFLIEAQIEDDETIALRAFQYGFAHARQTKSISEDESLITLIMPEARIIYWETSRKTPDKVILRLVFPDRSLHDYEIETFKMLDQSLETLEQRKMALLLPFTLLKFRKEVKKRSTTKEKRQQLAEQMKELLLALERIIERDRTQGLLSSADAGMILERIAQMHGELYKPYPEFEEANMQLEERLKSRWKEYLDEREKLGKQEGKREGKQEGERKMRNQVLELITKEHLTIEQLKELLTQEKGDTPPQ